MIELYYVETLDLPGHENMAWDCVLGELVDDVTLRFYTWQRPTLSLGKHQDDSDLDLEYVRSNGFDVVRRPSGGRAVLHWDEITYAVLVPRSSELFGTSVLELYKLISELIVEGLREQGYPVEIIDGRRKALTSVCFQVPSSYEIVLNGVKVVGSAQTRTGEYVLQHGSIILKPHKEVKYCFKSTKSLQIPLIGLYDVLEVPVEGIMASIKESFEKVFGPARPLPPELLERVRSLVGERAWRFVWRRG
ncbi:lipoate--protein ligase family protein [Fervidobacterium thailandense]|uniref:lipoate--protein ligase family protein n=1 Tax=Fervidobacterium thailandense TaxID=1008305 RepID=UPI000A791B21|nr:biotin/lipoate A/B protein ligase family protein [Fervidobacterium thailandense]